MAVTPAGMRMRSRFRWEAAEIVAHTRSETAIVELAATAAFENYRARFNCALGIDQIRPHIEELAEVSEVPVSCSMGRTSTPSWHIGTSRYDSPACRSEPGSVRAITKHQSATCASEVHTFCPSTTHSSRGVEPVETNRAFVDTAARSDPAPGSESRRTWRGGRRLADSRRTGWI